MLETVDEDAPAPAPRWVSNPSLQARIVDAELSVEMRMFLDRFHGGRPGFPLWTYNTLGFHPYHSMVDQFKKRSTEQYLFHIGLPTRERGEAYAEALWMEAIALTTKEDGVCTPRTHSVHPPDNTPSI